MSYSPCEWRVSDDDWNEECGKPGEGEPFPYCPYHQERGRAGDFGAGPVPEGDQ